MIIHFLEIRFSRKDSYMLSGGLGGAGATGGGYLQTIVITSSPSISNPG